MYSLSIPIQTVLLTENLRMSGLNSGRLESKFMTQKFFLLGNFILWLVFYICNMNSSNIFTSLGAWPWV